MIQIQDDSVTPMVNNSVASQVAAIPSTNDDQAKEKSIDDLLGQLETLNKEIEAKSVVQKQVAPVVTPALVQTPAPAPAPASIEASEPQPVLESSDEVSLPAPKKTEAVKKDDFDLDAFIKDLEEKIAQQNKVSGVEPAKTAAPVAEPVSEPVAEPVEPKVDEEAFFRKVRQKADLEEVATPEVVAPADLDVPAAKTGASAPKKTNEDLDKLIADLEQSLKEFESKKTETQSKPVAPAISPIPAVPPVAVPAIEGVPVKKPVVNAPATKEAVASIDAKASAAKNNESLEAQNIFEMLKLNELKQEEQEAFLNDLEKLIWDNFIATDLPLLLTNEEKAKADEILAQQAVNEEQKKEQLLVFLDDLIPNLEQVMYKKAIKLKKELFVERLRKTRNQAQAGNNLSLLADLDQIDDLIKIERYQTAVTLLNKA